MKMKKTKPFILFLLILFCCLISAQSFAANDLSSKEVEAVIFKASLGDAESQNKLGEMYFEGKGRFALLAPVQRDIKT